MNEEYLINQIDQATQYLLKRGNRGFEYWLKTKGFNPEDAQYLREALGYEKT